MGWFDFLKKKKAPQGDGSEKKMPDTADVDKVDRSKSDLHLNTETEQTMQKEAVLLQILDGLYDNPMKFLMQKKAHAEILKQLAAFLDSRPATKDYWSKEGKEILPVITGLLTDADAFAVAKGLKRSPQRMTLIINIAMLGGIIGIFTLLFAVPALAGIASYIYIGAMCAMCCLPQFIQKRVMVKLTKFQEANAAEFIRANATRLEVVHDMIQFLLADIRETLIGAGNDLNQIRFQLWNSDYKDIKVLDSKIVPGQAKSVYIVRFVKDDEDANTPEPVSTGKDADVDFDVDPSKDEAESDDVDDVDDDLETSDSGDKKPSK
jgi:hypothetical protein